VPGLWFIVHPHVSQQPLDMQLPMLLLVGSQATALWSICMHLLGWLILHETKQPITLYTQAFFASAVIVACSLLAANLYLFPRHRWSEATILNSLGSCLILSFFVASLTMQIVPYAIKI
jgi:hypothetical protein